MNFEKALAILWRSHIQSDASEQLRSTAPNCEAVPLDAYRRLPLGFGLIEPPSMNAATRTIKQIVKTSTEPDISPKNAAVPVAMKRKTVFSFFLALMNLLWFLGRC